ncbi:tetratricopeptide repeat protein [Kaarinaea lacus]
MDESFYKFLKYTAITLTIAWVGWSIYDSFMADVNPGDSAHLAADKFFEDGNYERALQEYELALQEVPGHIHALRGKARSLMQLNRYDEALQVFNIAIAQEPQFAGTYANRGILYDRMGQYQKAIEDYEHALALNSELAEGPNWLTRFLRLQPERPPTIADRAQYLKQELEKPESERILKVPEDDQQQRPYKL